MRRLAHAALAFALAAAQPALAGAAWQTVRGGAFESVLPSGGADKRVTVATFQLARTPVTNGDFLAFVRDRADWQRGRAPRLFVDEGYLRHWQGPDRLGDADPLQPVVNVSWFAAEAYCAAQGARLPTWHEWEYAAAADGRVADARADPAWRQRILNWYSQTGAVPRQRVGQTAANVHGVQDLHGLVWEWVQDFGGMMVSGDNREQGDPDLMKFCGTGALTLEQKENYAVLMRIAMLSSLKAAYTTGTLGFRCARDRR